MKLGIVLDRFVPPLGGAEQHTDALMRRALAQDHEVVLACLEGRGPDGVDTRIVRARRGRPERDRDLAERGVALLRETGCDVVYAIRHVLDCDVFLPHGGLVADARAAKDEATGGARWRTRVARTFSRKFDFFLECERALLGGPRGPHVIAVSEGVAARIRTAYPAAAARTTAVRNGVDGEHFDPAGWVAEGRALRDELGLQDDYVGLLLAHDPVLKGLRTALEALARPELRSLDVPFRLVVAGRRAPGDLRRLARELDVETSVRWVDAVSDPRPLYALADVVVHPTWYDPLSLVCLEALAMGVPVVTTPRNGVREIMGHRGGIVVEEPGNAEAIAYAVRVLADAGLRTATGEDARYLAEMNRASTRLDRVLDVCADAAARA